MNGQNTLIMKDNIRIIPKWSRSKEEIWRDHFEGLISEVRPPVKSNAHHFARLYYYAAAIVLIFIIPMIYTRTIVSQRGEHISYVLPDGSGVTLNADSKLIYKPLMWPLKREVRMDGEAYFEVEKKGTKFLVKSKNGVVKVLGTKFNVLSRGEIYRVSCISGKVQVISGGEAILEKGRIAFRGKDGTLVVEEMGEVKKNISWREGIFYFRSALLEDVINEISRQYDISIEYSEINGHLYTGNFSRESKIDSVLEIIALPFGLRPEKTKNGYKLVKQ